MIKNIVGKQFGHLKVLIYPIKQRKHHYALCQCNCGTIKLIRRDGFIENRVQSCGCYNKKVHSKARAWKIVPRFYRAKIRLVYADYRHVSKKHNRIFNLTKQQFVNKIFKKCYYCGNIQKRGFNGLDRINNKKGYLLNNIVPCCNICNHAKNTLTIIKFKNWIGRVYVHSIK